MHLLLTSYITITPHAAPFAQLFASGPRTLFHSSESTYADYILAENVHRLIARLRYATEERSTRRFHTPAFPAGKMIKLDRRGASKLRYVAVEFARQSGRAQRSTE